MLRLLRGFHFFGGNLLRARPRPRGSLGWNNTGLAGKKRVQKHEAYLYNLVDTCDRLHAFGPFPHRASLADVCLTLAAMSMGFLVQTCSIHVQPSLHPPL